MPWSSRLDLNRWLNDNELCYGRRLAKKHDRSLAFITDARYPRLVRTRVAHRADFGRTTSRKDVRDTTATEEGYSGAVGA